MTTMTGRRLMELQLEMAATLTPEELAQGWHFCPDWDYDPVGPDTPAMLEGCHCERSKK